MKCAKTMFKSILSWALRRLKTKQHRTLLNKGLSNQINPVLTKLMLINNHGYTEKTEVKKENEIQVVQLQTHFGDEPDYKNMTNEELDEIIRKCEESLQE